jgi:hypothetical protein
MDNKKSVVAVLVILTFLLVGVLALKSFVGSKPAVNNSPSNFPVQDIVLSPEDTRDEQRIKDLIILSEKIDINNADRGNYAFVANDWQNISDEESGIFRELQETGNLENPLKDPSQDKYYSYWSDGNAYELRATLENKNSGKCEMSGELCIYKIRKELKIAADEDYTGYEYDNAYTGE